MDEGEHALKSLLLLLLLFYSVMPRSPFFASQMPSEIENFLSIPRHQSYCPHKELMLNLSLFFFVYGAQFECAFN